MLIALRAAPVFRTGNAVVLLTQIVTIASVISKTGPAVPSVRRSTAATRDFVCRMPLDADVRKTQIVPTDIVIQRHTNVVRTDNGFATGLAMIRINAPARAMTSAR